MKKRLICLILALIFTAFALSSCCPGEPNGTTASQSQPQKPADTAQSFAALLQDTLLNETQSDVKFEVKEKHRYNNASSMEKRLFAEWKADFSDRENPKFSYWADRSANAAEPEILLCYDGSYFYVKDAESKYRHPAFLAQATEGIPYNALTAIFGNRIAEMFSAASVTKSTDGALTAYINVPLADHAAAVVSYLKGFGIEASGVPYETDGSPLPLSVCAVLSKDGKLLSYSVESVMQASGQGGVYSAVYTVNAVCSEIGDGFSVPLPDGEAQSEYTEAEPVIDSITAEEFLNRFEKSDEKSNLAVYTEMTTNASAVYEFASGALVTIPLQSVTALDLSKPKSPKISVVESKLNAMGVLQKTEVYYKDDMYYYAVDGYRTAVPYPAEEYLANVEASAKEKEEAGISSVFLTAEMLKNATLTVNPDQSVSASLQFDGETQKKNIFYNIKSLYNDDLAEMQSAEFLDAAVSVTVDRFNYLTDYTLSVTVSVESNGTLAVISYTANYHYEYDESPREIDFPDGLDSWGAQ